MVNVIKKRKFAKILYTNILVTLINQRDFWFTFIKKLFNLTVIQNSKCLQTKIHVSELENSQKKIIILLSFQTVILTVIH